MEYFTILEGWVAANVTLENGTRHVQELSASYPSLSQLALRVIACDEARGHDHIINISGRNARKRITRLLLELFDRVSHHFPPRRGDRIQCPLALELVGNALGLTSVHVSRTPKLLREQDVVRVLERQLEILDPVALIRAAGFEGSIALYDPEPAIAAET